LVNLTINGVQCQAEPGSTILQAAQKIGIHIPTLCYDERLVAHGACRICVVEVKGARALMPSCSAPVAEGMVIETNSPSVIEARKEILRLMIENHPLDCLTCEKSGNCTLQNLCYEYDIKEGGYKGEKKNYPVDDSNPFFTYDPNKCILCGRCVRVDNELQCTGAINLIERGFYTHVGVAGDKTFEDSNCVSCGNCVSVCPVGALMPKQPEKFRQWEVKRVRTTCSYCGVGCQMELLVKDNKVVGVEPVNIEPNDGLLCVKGKFGYRFLSHPDRLKTPLIRKDGELKEASWDEAMDLIASKIKEIKKEHGSEAFGALSSARCTNEENYLMQKLFRAVIGTNNIDHCARL
jgi:NADH-quinone oxidoreductase subunit G